MPLPIYGTSIEVYNRYLGVYGRSGGQVNTSGKTKSMAPIWRTGEYLRKDDIYGNLTEVLQHMFWSILPISRVGELPQKGEILVKGIWQLIRGI